jgi:hypothetical protein
MYQTERMQFSPKMRGAEGPTASAFSEKALAWKRHLK